MPPKEAPTMYSVQKTHMWFAIVSMILTGSLVWTVYQDYAREWKDYQRAFVRLKTEKLKVELAAAEGSVDKAKLSELEKQLALAQADFKKNQEGYRAQEKELAKLDLITGTTKSDAQSLKQFEDSYKFYFEEYRAHKDPRAADYEAKLKALAPKVRETRLKLEGLEKQKEEKEKELAEYSAKSKDLQAQIDLVLTDKNRAEMKYQAARPTWAKEILNAPVIDFVAPSLRIQQVVLEDLYDDYHFTKVQKVDRCTTCHLGIDQKGFEDAPQPFRTHPKIDLFLGASSPHPLEKVGCTVCHEGSGHSASFIDSAHTPRNEEQKKEWEKKYKWRELAKWDHKMLPLNHTEASCVKCHKGATHVPEAAKLNEGRKLAETFGCTGCHKIGGFDRWKVGPDLRGAKTKLEKEWIIKWLQDPKAFRPSTKMPRIFHLSNTSGPEDRARGNASIEAVAAYLMKNSDPVELLKAPAGGNPENGKKLIDTVGCLGCHTANGVSVNNFGPELSGMGSKVSADWLFTWIKDPKKISPQTLMPNLRLSDQEAADITSYLLTQKNEDFDKQSIPPVEPQAVDELVLVNLQKNLRQEEAKAELAKMTQDDRLEFLGKQTISHQGCFACHDIKGFEDAKPIGTELTREGQKDVHQLDFALIHMEHTRQAFFLQKMKEPRIFDKGKEKEYYEKLRMPDFGFTEEQSEALTTFLLSLTQDYIPLEMQKKLDARETKVEAGRLLVSKFNCQGCHTLDGVTGHIREAITDQGSAPPNLNTQGSKVQEKWIHEFLKAPSSIRPWLTYRMPTFGFSDEQVRAFVEYFAALDKQELSYRGADLPETTPEKLAAGKTLFEAFQCIKCHKTDPASLKMGASFLAPDLTMSKDRLKAPWVVSWLKDPQAITEGTMMPGFFADGQTPMPDLLDGDAVKQMEAITDYLFRYAPEPAPAAAVTPQKQGTSTGTAAVEKQQPIS